ncbi:MAG: efflux transporter outer membrane subunit [Proteobacteria bacterium]|nr:efflux transporter outer membrane subunit [Pseudomonadota bacterium]
MNWRHLPVLCATVAFNFAGCAPVGPDYRRPVIDLPAAYPEAAAGSRVMQNLPAKWWTLYGDASLNELVAAALANNVDVRIAVAKLEEADAALREANATLFPQVDLAANSSRARSSALNAQPIPPGVSAIQNNQRVAALTAYELDFWGRLRRADEAARAQALGTRYAKDVVDLTLVGAVAQAYFITRSIDAQIIVTRESLLAREESLAVVKSRARGGLASDLDVNQAEGARADAAVQLKDLQRLRVLFEHELGTLTGKLALKLPAGDLRTLPVPPSPPADLPSSLLERRPDVRVAEQALVSANAQIGVAKAAQLPTFVLAASAGGQSAALANLLTAGAGIWSIGLTAAMPIIDFGKYAARTEQAEARQRQAVAFYQKSAETAFREVADALSNVQQASEMETDLQARVDAGRNALRLAQRRYEAGYSGFLEVLDSQRTANDAELALLRHRRLRLSFSLDLMKSLGGGWSPEQANAQR